MSDEEEFFAWLDGELDGDAAARVEARVAADPALAEQARAHRALAGRLRGAFDPVMSAAVPDRIGSGPVDFAEAREKRTVRPISHATRWAAIAATLVVGIVTGTMLSTGSTAPVVRENGTLVAAAELEDALDTRLASAPESEGVRIGLTFRDSEGALCRSFESDDRSGLACRADGDWRIRGLFDQNDGPAGDYRMASGADPGLAELIEATIAGEPFDADAERAARESGWR